MIMLFQWSKGLLFVISSTASEDMQSEDGGECGKQCNVQSNPRDFSEVARRSAALFILKTTEKHTLPLSVMDALTHDISFLITNAVDQVLERISVVLSETGIDTTVISQICSQEAITNPFVGLESNYL